MQLYMCKIAPIITIISLYIIIRANGVDYSRSCYDPSAYDGSAYYLKSSADKNCDFIYGVYSSPGYQLFVYINWTSVTAADISTAQEKFLLDFSDYCCKDKRSLLWVDYSRSCNDPSLYSGSTYTGNSYTMMLSHSSSRTTCDRNFFYYSKPGRAFENINWQSVTLADFSVLSLATLNSLGTDCCGDGNSIAKNQLTASSSCGQTLGITSPTNLNLKTDFDFYQNKVNFKSTLGYQGEQSQKIAVADFNLDGFDDFVVGTYFDSPYQSMPSSISGLTVFTNNHFGHFNVGRVIKSNFVDIFKYCFDDTRICGNVTFSPNPIITDVLTADMDGDGFVDIIATWPHFPLIAWSRNSGDGSFENIRTISSNVRAYSLATLDVNNDGSIDLVAGSFGRNSTNECKKVLDEDKAFESIYDPDSNFPYIEHTPDDPSMIKNCSALATCNLTCSLCIPRDEYQNKFYENNESSSAFKLASK